MELQLPSGWVMNMLRLAALTDEDSSARLGDYHDDMQPDSCGSGTSHVENREGEQELAKNSTLQNLMMSLSPDLNQVRNP